MAVYTHTADKQIDASCGLDSLFVLATFGLPVFCIAVKDVHVFFGTVDMVEQIAVHKRVVAFGMLNGQAHVFVHIERNNVLKRYPTLLACLYQSLVHAYGSAASGQSQHKGAFLSGCCFINTFNDVFSCPIGQSVIICLYY